MIVEKLVEAALHNIPFMALMAAPQTANRPLATRLSEQTIVAIITAALVLWVANDRQDAKIATVIVSLQEIKADMVLVRSIAQDVAVNKVRLDAIERRNHKRDDALREGGP